MILVCVCVEWSLVSVYSKESLASWHVTCDVPCCGLPLWDPHGSRGGPATPFPPGSCRDRSKPSADGAASVFRFSSTSKEDVERALEVGLALAPITDARRRLRLWRGPAGRVLGRNRCNLSPWNPSVSTSVVEPILSSCPRSFSFTHWRGVVGQHPSLHQTINVDTKILKHTRLFCCLVSSSQKKQEYKLQSTVADVSVYDPQRANSRVVLTQAFSSAGYDKLLGWPRPLPEGQHTLPSALALSPAATRQTGFALYLAGASTLHDGKSL